MQVTFEQVGKHVIAECQTTKACGVGFNNSEALVHLEEELAIYAIESQKPFYEERRAISNRINRELFYRKK
jgi:hypothetical protein